MQARRFRAVHCHLLKRQASYAPITLFLQIRSLWRSYVELFAGSKEILRRARILEETGNSRPHLPFGVTLIGPAWTDEFLWEIAAKYHAKSGLECGPAGHNVTVYRHR